MLPLPARFHRASVESICCFCVKRPEKLWMEAFEHEAAFTPDDAANGKQLTAVSVARRAIRYPKGPFGFAISNALRTIGTGPREHRLFCRLDAKSRARRPG